MENKTIFFDLETTSADVSTAEIIQFSAIIDPGEPAVFSMAAPISIYIMPKGEISEGATEVHGLTKKILIEKNAKSFSEHIPLFQEIFSKGSILAGYNILGFDIPVLMNELTRHGKSFDPDNYKYIDVFKLYQKLHPRTLKAAYIHYTGEDMKDAHDAMADTLATQEIFQCMITQHAEEEVFDGEIFENNIDFFNKHSLTEGAVDIISGRFIEGKNGIEFSFGKWKGQLVSIHLDYVRWMLTSGNFAPDTQKACKELLEIK